MSMMVNPYKIGVATPVAPSVIASDRTVQNTSGVTVTVNSASPVSGELIILHLAHGTNLASGTGITWPSGFTQGGRQNASRASGAWAWKIAGSSEPSTYTVSWSTGNTRSILSCVRIQNHNGLDSEFINSRTANTNAPKSGATTSTTAPCLRLYFYSGGWGGGTLTVTPEVTTPASSVVLSEVMTSTGNQTDGAGGFCLAKEETTTSLAQLTHTISWSVTGSGMHYVAFTIPIKRI